MIFGRCYIKDNDFGSQRGFPEGSWGVPNDPKRVLSRGSQGIPKDPKGSNTRESHGGLKDPMGIKGRWATRAGMRAIYQ